MSKEIVSPVDTPLHRRPWLGPGGLVYSGLPYVWESIPWGKDSVESRGLLTVQKLEPRVVLTLRLSSWNVQARPSPQNTGESSPQEAS